MRFAEDFLVWSTKSRASIAFRCLSCFSKTGAGKGIGLGQGEGKGEGRGKGIGQNQDISSTVAKPGTPICKSAVSLMPRILVGRWRSPGSAPISPLKPQGGGGV
jgi:hypothetical protein